MADPFVWYDLMTPDVAGSVAFYEAVVGWKVIPSSLVTDGSYSILSRGEYEFGGIKRTSPEGQALNIEPHWSGYLFVDDVDAKARRVVELGGSIVLQTWETPGAGRFCVVADPFGARFNLTSPPPGMNTGEGPDHGPVGTQGSFGWHELLTRDHVAAFEFYATLFGWQKTEALDMGEMGLYQMVGIGSDVSVAAMMNIPEKCPEGSQTRVDPMWNYYINVPSIDAAAEAITAHGGSIDMGPHEVPGGQWIVCGVDPQRARFNLVGKIN